MLLYVTKKLVYVKNGSQFFTIPPSPRILKTCIELNRDKMLDEAIFLLICAKSHLTSGSKLIGKVRVDLAKSKIEKISNYLAKD